MYLKNSNYNYKALGISLFLLLGSFWGHLRAHTIGLCVVATGRYIEFADQLICSAEKFFCKNHRVLYFIFSDQKTTLPLENVCLLPHHRLGWPLDTLKRAHVYNFYEKELSQCDYLFACDADMLFVAPVNNEILGQRVATQHPGFISRRGSYETNPISTAYIPSHQGKNYFAGGFYGGSKKEFFHINKTLQNNIDKDLAHNYIAVWHDESYLNHYFIYSKPPSIILSPSYCFPGYYYPKKNKNFPYLPKLIALDKNHAEYRK